MPDKLCQNCKFWGKLKNEAGFARCAVASGLDGESIYATTKAYAKDAANQDADLLTKADFGCVQWLGSLLRENEMQGARDE